LSGERRRLPNVMWEPEVQDDTVAKLGHSKLP